MVLNSGVMIFKGTRIMEGKTIRDCLCKTNHITSQWMRDADEDPFAFADTDAEFQHRNGNAPYKVTFDPEYAVTYQGVDHYAEYKGKVDEVDVNEYIPSMEGDRIFYRKLMTDATRRMLARKYNDQSYTTAQLRTLDALRRMNIEEKLTMENIKKLTQNHPPIGTITEETNISTLDEIITDLASRITPNVINTGVSAAGHLNRGHPFYPPQILTPDKLIADMNIDAEYSGIFSAYLYASWKLSHTGLHFEDFSLAALNVHVGGGIKLWTMLSEEMTEKLYSEVLPAENKRRNIEDNCPAYMRKKDILVTHKFLDDNGIKFTIALQGPGDIIVQPPNCAHQVISLDVVANHSINFMTEYWLGLPRRKLYECQNPGKGTNKEPGCNGAHGFLLPHWIHRTVLLTGFGNGAGFHRLHPAAAKGIVKRKRQLLQPSSNGNSFNCDRENNSESKRAKELCHCGYHNREENKECKEREGEENNHCKTCEKRYVDLRGLRKHVLNWYKPRNFKCSTCGKDFKTSQALNRHETTHNAKNKHSGE